MSGPAGSGLGQPAPGGARELGVEGEAILLELSEAQVNQVLRATAGAGSMSLGLSGSLDAFCALDGAVARVLEDHRLSRSLLLGLMLLAAMPADGSYAGIAELARAHDLSAGSTHRYVSTWLAIGLVERDPATRRYRRAGAAPLEPRSGVGEAARAC